MTPQKIQILLLETLLNTFSLYSQLVVIRPILTVTGSIILLYMSGLLLRRMQEWQKRRRIQLINSRNKISLEPKERKCENQISIKIPLQSKIEINNQAYNPEVTNTWHNYVLSTVGPLTLLIPQIYAKTNIIFVAEILEFRIHIIFVELIYVISVYRNNRQLRNFVKTALGFNRMSTKT